MTAHLDGESYAMRKCVLAVLGEIVARVLSKEELTEADRDDRDSFLERHVMEAGLALCDDGRLVVVEGATHWLHLEQPERVTREVLTFLAG